MLHDPIRLDHPNGSVGLFRDFVVGLDVQPKTADLGVGVDVGDHGLVERSVDAATSPVRQY